MSTFSQQKPKEQKIFGEIIGVMDSESSSSGGGGGGSGSSSGGGSSSSSGGGGGGDISGSSSSGISSGDQLQVLLQSGDIYFIDKATWEPFEELLSMETVRAYIYVEGKTITKIEM